MAKDCALCRAIRFVIAGGILLCSFAFLAVMLASGAVPPLWLIALILLALLANGLLYRDFVVKNLRR